MITSSGPFVVTIPLLRSEPLTPACVEGNYERLQTWNRRCHEAIMHKNLCADDSFDPMKEKVGGVDGL
jgi:hypothetical protein